MNRTSTWVVAMTIAAVPAAAADDSGVYIGAAVGWAIGPDDVHLGTPDVPLLVGEGDADSTSFGLGAGYRFNENISIELGYVDLGEMRADVADATSATDARAAAEFSAEGVTLALVGEFPVGKWQPYLKAGVLFSDTVLEYSGSFAGTQFGARLSGDSEDALYGVGVRYEVSERLRLYVDSTYFMEVGQAGTGQSDYLNTSAGVVWQF